MADISFSEPVILKMPGIGARLVTTVFEALECLENEWPNVARDRHWNKSKAICRDALDGWRTSNEARRSLVKAAAKSGLLWSSKTDRIDRNPIWKWLEVRRPASTGS
jgi:hypothetical protein